MKVAQGISPCGAFIFHILIKSPYKFQFWGPIPLPLRRWGWILAQRRGPNGGGEPWFPPTCQISPTSVQRVAPAKQKCSKQLPERGQTTAVDQSQRQHCVAKGVARVCLRSGNYILLKNLKIGLWVTYIPALCASRNAAGNYGRSTFLWRPDHPYTHRSTR